jgi:hypothetical protein
MNWLLQGASSNGAYFNQRIFQPLVVELQGQSWSKRYPWTLLHIDNTKPHISRSNLAIIKELHLKRTARLPFSPDIAFFDFFLFGWLKIELVSQPVAEIDKLFPYYGGDSTHSLN